MIEIIKELSALAYQYGPFFFAIFFTMYITRQAYNMYNQDTTPDKLKTYRLYFLSTVGFGMLLVVAAIAWWFVNPPSRHVFEGSIKDLYEYESVTSSTLYFKPVYIKLEEGTPPIRHEEFVFVQDKPFTKGQTFEIYFGKGQGRVEKFAVTYDRVKKPSYRVEWDPAMGKSILKKIASTEVTSQFLMVNNAHASMDYPRLDNVNYIKVSGIQQRSDDYFNFLIAQDSEELIVLLQNERTDIGTKIEIIGWLVSLDDEKLKKALTSSTPKEPIILTITDLSRHNDKELAYKSRKIIEDRFPLDEYLSGKLLSSNQKERDEASAIMFRLDPAQSKMVLNRISRELHSPWLSNLQKNIVIGENVRPLIPTGSRSGDRYYVRADWDRNNKVVAECLTTLFDEYPIRHNDALISKRSREDEAKMMKDRSSRLVYWYSKEWALDIAESIKKCGGKASFVNGFAKK